MSKILSNNLKGPVVVAMVAVRMMEMAVHKVVNMVAMRNGGMSAFGAVNMLRLMFGGGISRRAFVRVGRINGNSMFIHVVAMRMMKMAILKIINMPFVPDGGVAASGCVHVRRIRVGCTRMFAHIFAFLFLFPRVLQNNHLIRQYRRKKRFCKWLAYDPMKTIKESAIEIEQRRQNEIAPRKGFVRHF